MTTINEASAVYYRSALANRVYAGAVRVWPGYRNAILATPGLVGYYRFGEPNSSVNPQDATGNNNTNRWDRPDTMLFGQPGAVSGDTAIHTGTNGLAVIEGPLTGWIIRDDAPIPHEPGYGSRRMGVLDLGDGPLTLEAWVSPGAVTGAYRCCLSKGGGAYTLYINPDGRAAMHASAVGEICHSTNPIPVSGWHHIVATKLAADVHIYIDGVSGTVFVSNRVLTDNVGQWLFVGSENANGWPGNWFNGLLDEVAVYNQVLTPTQVLQHYNAR
jgi:Concanavalin A-like lectin/glucanases superfamily